MRALIKLINTVIIITVMAIIPITTVIFSIFLVPFMLSSKFRAYLADCKKKNKWIWDYLKSHRAVIMTSPKPNKAQSIPAFGISLIIINYELIRNKGVLYHELGHCAWEPANPNKIGGARLHNQEEPELFEVMADMYAVKAGYGNELIDFLKGCDGDAKRRIEIIDEAMQA
jgi:hypothetical protein